MKKLFILLIFAAFATSMKAVPALKGIWQTITLNDGQEVLAELCGDEFMAFWQTADGVRYALDEATGKYKIADIDAMTVRAAEWRNAAQKPVAARLKGKRRVTLGTPVTEFQGKKKGLVILVQFSDLSFREGHTLDLYKQIINGDNYSDETTGFVGSVKDYFKAQSYGQFEIDFDVAGPVTMSHGYAYYGADTNGATVNPDGIAEMIEAACEAVEDSINFADYDWSGDGEADLVFFVYAGEGQNNGASSNTIWPHMSTYSSMSGGNTLVLDNTKIDTYACSCEVGKYNDIDGIGTICHEFSHCFGLPDMYDLNGSNYATGNWDVLCYGNYNGSRYGDGLIPAGYTSYERWFAGWLEPVELADNTTVTSMKPLVDEGEAYIIYNDKHKNEYYLLENREKESWDAGLAGAGMLILHVNYSQSAWAGNDVNTDSERYTIFAANNNKTTNGESGHPYPYGSNNELTNTSSPASTLANANYDGTFFMNKPVTDITLSSDGLISFAFANENDTSMKDSAAPDSYVFYESFDFCSGTGGNDGDFSSSSAGGVQLSGNTDNDGWEASNNMAVGADKCAFMGSNLFAGELISPEITTTADSRLIFKAAPFSTDPTTLMLSVYSGDVSLEETSCEMQEGQWTDFTMNISGSGTFRLRFAANKRAFIDEVYVTYETVSGIANISAATTAGDTRVFSVDGRCIGSDINAVSSKGIYISGGKKIVK